MAEASESERRADSSSSKSSSPPSHHDKYVQDPLTPAPLSFVSSGSPQVGPASSVREDELCDWRKKYLLPSSVVLRIPRSSERASGGMPKEIAIYEAFFESGFRRDVSSLIASLSDYFHISPSQLTPPAWRILIAIKNLGDEESLAFRVSEVLFAYHMAPINGHEGRFHLRLRAGLPIVEELPKTDRKGLAFGKKWPERYVFMTLPGSHYRCNFVGEGNVLQARKLPLERRRVTHLLSLEVLRRSKLWDGIREEGPDDPMIAFKKATYAISARRDSSSRNASGDGTTTAGNKRRMIRRSDDISPSQGGRPREGVSTRSQRPLLTGYSSGGLSGVLADLNANVFARMPTLRLDKDPSGIIHQVQGELLQVLSHLHQLKERIVEEDLSMNRDEISELSRQLSEDKSRRVAKELELRDLQAKIRAIEGSVETASSESLRLSREKQELEKTIVDLRAEAETSKNMMTMAVNGARIVAYWEVMREWLKGQAHKWNLAREFSQFKTVILAEAEFKGTEPPSFEDEPAIPSSRSGRS
ncbi:Uncharacterized protein Rs2_45439 [Raphanus sativus]|nr:Uncharacterized protein Rs2_45439 [Raphanus sativus]